MLFIWNFWKRLVTIFTKKAAKLFVNIDNNNNCFFSSKSINKIFHNIADIADINK